MLTHRSATPSDIAFLSQIIYDASLPPHNHSFWDDMVQDSGTPALPFIAAMLKTRATNWSQVEDFLIIEQDGKPVAAASGYEATAAEADYRPLKLSGLSQIAQELGWSAAAEAAFRDRYTAMLGQDPHPLFLKPQAPWIIEYVAVLAEARGQGIGKVLLRSLLEKAKTLNQLQVGIMIVNGNERARKVYESLGFQPYQSFHAAYFLDQFGMEFPGFSKLVTHLELDPA